MTRLGSLFTGAGLLDEGVRRVFGGELAWFAEHDPDAERRSAWCRAAVQARHPDALSLGDVCRIDGSALPPVDVLALGFPCQNISPAGDGSGLDGERSGLWSEVPRILGEMPPSARPDIAILENSAYLTRRGLAAVLRDLAALGYDAGWQVIGAVATGAPHIRARCAIVARRDGKLPVWPDLGPFADRWLADWWTPGREPMPRTVPPYPRGDARVRWRINAVEAMGNGVVVSWAEMVATAARDALPPMLGFFGTPPGHGIEWADALPPSGIMWGGQLYEAPRVYSEGDAKTRVLASPLCRMYGRLLPTPTKHQFSSNQGGAAGRTGPVRPALQPLARMLPTPVRADGRGAGPNQNTRTLGRLAARGALATAMLPTPAAVDGRRGPAVCRARRLDSLVTASALLATPTRKGNDNRAGLTERSGDGLATQARMMPGAASSTLLHPEWVAWLMGAGPEFVPLLDASEVAA